MSTDRGFPQYHFTMRGTEAIRIRYEGQDLGVFDKAGLWEEYRKTMSHYGYLNDPNKRYVIERAIEVFEGKSPEYRQGWTPTVKPKPKKRKKGFLARAWDRIRGLS